MFYEIEIQTNKEGQDSKGIYSYETRDDALKIFHQKMASGITAGLNGTLSKVLNMIINEHGGTETREFWEAPVEPEPEPEPETNYSESESEYMDIHDYTEEDINNMKSAELKELAKQYGISGYSSMTAIALREALIGLLNE